VRLQRDDHITITLHCKYSHTVRSMYSFVAKTKTSDVLTIINYSSSRGILGVWF